MLALDRTELGVREPSLSSLGWTTYRLVISDLELLHDHANEQPFTRSRSGIAIPEDVAQVIIQGRDLVNGWGGEELTVLVPR